MSLKRSAIIGILAGAALVAQASAARIDITNDSIPAGATKSWVASNSYVLHGKVVVKAGSRLNIAAGTMIYGAGAPVSDSVSMLIVARDGRLYATGTAAQPIVFTSILDTGSHSPLAISDNSRGLWGGINIFGRAPCNTPGGVDNSYSSDITITDTSWITFGDSGNVTSAATYAKNLYDTSGVLEYVSVRYTGAADMSEIKGLMFCGVGAGTVVDHCEVFMCNEDGINFTGGTVNAKYLISAFQAGDALMLQGGYQGNLQYVFAIQTVITSSTKNGCMSKWESGDFNYAPITNAHVYNATFIGTGKNNPDTWKYNYGLYIKDRAAGTFANSILSQCSHYGVYVEDFLDAGDSTGSRYHLVNDSTLVIKNDIFYGFGGGDYVDSIFEGFPFLQAYAAVPGRMNDTLDPVFGGLGWARTGLLDPRPSATGPATQHVGTVPTGGFFDQTTYRGAFAPTGALWATGWSALGVSNGSVFTAGAVPVLNSKILSAKAVSDMKITGKGDVRLLTWNQLNAGKSSIRIYAVNGELLHHFDNGNQGVGVHSVSISLKDIPAGVYVLQAKSADQVFSNIIEKQ
jgi:trimeric autotransporter adhesin